MKTKLFKFFFSLSILVFSAFLPLACLKSSQESTSAATAILENPPQISQTGISDTIAVSVLKNISIKDEERYIRGIHLSSWMSGSGKQNRAVIEMIKKSELNAVVIDLKETDGQICISDIDSVYKGKISYNLIPNLSGFIKELKENNIYIIARIVAFRDNSMPRKDPSLAVKTPSGAIWTDKNRIAWLDPYNPEAWDYILKIAERASELGFDEIQFDYIRFPTDGDLSTARYSNKNHSNSESSKAIVSFLKEANRRLKARGVKISIDTFGLTVTGDDMGIGQKISDMAQWVDFISPMVYPSHYAKGAYGASEPNKAPYRIVYESMKDAVKRIPAEKFRPWLQDFTIFNYKYGKDQVRAQIQACYDNGIGSWLLWNPRCIYTVSALKGPDEENRFVKSRKK
ncbi:MAG: putative glycoside hydrolase [Elusimicrobiota bacterium]|nr:putative glycoside hydrolase [Elusimicrobiota bacterium]